MKNYRLFAICLALLLHVPCYSEVVSETVAMNVAKRFLGVGRQKARAVKRLKFRDCDTRGAQDASYYIFTGADGTGWVIVSADDIARPVLGYSVDGCIGDDSGLPDAMQELMDDITSQVRQARADGLSQSEEVRRMWAEATMGQTMRLLETASWNHRQASAVARQSYRILRHVRPKPAKANPRHYHCRECKWHDTKGDELLMAKALKRHNLKFTQLLNANYAVV